jgi:two-component system response regulator HydG
MTIAPNILVIDDEQTMRDSCVQILSRDGHTVKVAEDGATGLEMMRTEVFDLIILDLKMPGLSGMEVLRTVHENDPSAIVVVITGYGTVESAVEAMKAGAYDFVSKPFTPERLRAIVKRAIERKRLTLENLFLSTELKSTIGDVTLIGKSKAMQEVDGLVRKVGPTDSTVLIYGESGTGKELVARALHRHSPRRERPFVVVDCGTLVENLFESELFGHIKGSFTGATTTKYGRFELANGGTIFFDEIGNISTNVQAKLLRAIQEREVTKVGSAQVVRIDVRIIAATNRDLASAVKDGSFRDDLFYRLSVVPIELPPLRERREDIPLLANYFLCKYNRERKKNILGITNTAMERLALYEWPGNVRELENAIERAVVLAEGDVIEPTDVLYYGLAPMEADSEVSDQRTLAEIEEEHIRRTLRALDGHKGRTAEALSIDRKTLREKLKRYGITD